MWLDIQSVATVPTACGIETWIVLEYQPLHTSIMLQQCLPLAVLKLFTTKTLIIVVLQIVATVPTACGIETCSDVCEDSAYLLLHVATVPTACGIETL